MTFPDNLDTAFPARRSDEPAELRGRIVKEVQDHLECAYRRELLRTGDAAEAARRVQAQFGDPRRVARKLWFDAMREKIMLQRIVVGIALLATTVSLALGGMMVRAAQQIAEQGRESQQALLATLERLAAKPAERPAANQVGVTIKLVKDAAGGAPAAGYSVEFANSSQANGVPVNLAGQTDGAGCFDAGLVMPSAYLVLVRTPWGEVGQRTIYIRGRQSDETVELVCPGSPAPAADLTIDVDWPEELRSKDVGLLCECSPGTRDLGDCKWWHGNPGNRDFHQLLLVTRDGVLLRMPRPADEMIDNRCRDETAWLRFEGFQAEPVPIVRAGATHTVQALGIVLLNTDGNWNWDDEAARRFLILPPARDPTVHVAVADGAAGLRVRIPISAALRDRLHSRVHYRMDTDDEARGTYVPLDGQHIPYYGSDRPAITSPHVDDEIEKVVREADSLTSEGKFAAALDTLNEAIRRDPEQARLFSARQWFWYRREEWDRAIEDCTAVIRLTPQNETESMVHLYCGRAALWEKKSEFQKAAEDYSEALRIDPDSVWARRCRANASIACGDVRTAVTDLEYYVRVNLGDTGTSNQLAWLLATLPDRALRDGKRARELANRACEMSAWSNWDCIESLAAAEAENGQFDLAAKWQQRALQVFSRKKATDLDDEDREVGRQMQSRLTLYQSGTAYRETPKR